MPKKKGKNGKSSGKASSSSSSGNGSANRNGNRSASKSNKQNGGGGGGQKKGALSSASASSASASSSSLSSSSSSSLSSNKRMRLWVEKAVASDSGSLHRAGRDPASDDNNDQNHHHFTQIKQPKKGFKPKDLLTQEDEEIEESLNLRTQIDNFLQSTGSLFYPTSNPGEEIWNDISFGFEAKRLSAYNVINAPYRIPRVWETWTPVDIATFEAGVCAHGKIFHKIQKMLPHKTINEIVSMFYTWKVSSHYYMWKRCKRKTVKIAGDEQREKVQKAMQGFQ
mmetsp:Transcript_6530/g.12008  ORF Transcript_6530/g.12008 Transcript_6530/m.12008 type:complete len:281 (+) Transcript_6530:147-989(+)|eukprot:CAMPEP_0197519910 /NCGR_PEP_ID=MMETSP1318-20131121/5206_1 /TAXON_ID=552666 /ORGANISM="Partenskyella glossopodia, Strain RCC365" /LENGTH=280 /DNA_ID=CAMNT_0043071165 /DNA_START=144 /DNA_END=986 /DNA_ORIENTATION=-